MTAQGEQIAAQGKRLDTVASRLAIVDGQLGRVATAQEQNIIPYIKLLDEGHQNILHAVTDQPRLDALEKDMRLVKNTLKNHAPRIAALEKAN